MYEGGTDHDARECRELADLRQICVSHHLIDDSDWDHPHGPTRQFVDCVGDLVDGSFHYTIARKDHQK